MTAFPKATLVLLCRTSCFYHGRYLQVMPGGRKHLEKAEKSSREAEDMAASDSGMQEWRELIGLEDVPEGNSPVTDEHGQNGPFEDTDEEEDTGLCLYSVFTC